MKDKFDGLPILFVDHATAVGGAENSLLLLSSRLNRNKWQPHLATNPGQFLDVATATVPTHALSLPQLRRSPRFLTDWFTTARQLVSLTRQLNAHLLYANTVRAAFYTAVAAKLAQRPFIWHMRDFYLSENKPVRLRLDTLLKRLLITSATAVITNSHATARHLPPSNKIHVVHNGIDLTQFDPTQSGVPFRQKFNIPPDAPLVGMVGRLRPWKGQQRFLQIAKHIHELLPSAYFAIIGGDPFKVNDNYAQLLKLKAESLPFAKQIVFTGQMADVASALAALDVFVHPGDPEPFGLVNVEAMAMAKPVVAFNHGALPEIVVPDQTGHLVPPGDTAVMAEAILSLLGNPEKTKTLGQNGRRRAEAHFDIHRAVSQIETIFDEILAA